MNRVTGAGRIMVVGSILVLVACAGDGAGGPAEDADPRATELATGGSGARAGPAAPVESGTTSAGLSLEADREIFEATMDRAAREGLASLPIGDRIVALGQWFVGADYVPGTLEVVPEQLVVNLREFDCVTYVESILAMARVLGRPDPAFEAFLDELRLIRYRGGVLAGYPSRLHYFSDWILDNDELGIVDDITRELGGIPLNEPIDFMTANRELYAALESDEVLAQIGLQEKVLSGRQLAYVPKGRIGIIVPRIQDGDIIAATSAIRGLDVAHTGLAIWIDGNLHLMHAPLVGSSVEISDLPLAARIVGISGQDGIMVARAVE